MSDCIFCKISSGEAPAHTVYEDSDHMAFLSIFPNTDGVTVVIPKKHQDSYAFGVSDETLISLMRVVKKVAQKIDGAFDDTSRSGMIFEGFGVDHLHAKLYPMHGTGKMKEWENIESGNKRDEFNKYYQGYLSSHDSQRADDEKLKKIAKKIKNSLD